MTTANKITIARIVMIPLFVMMAIYYGRGVQTQAPQDWQRWCAIAIFMLAAASDGIDGYIARHYNQRSRLGVLLDPVADKGLLLGGILTLTFSNWSYEFPIWFPVLVIARDLILLIGAATLNFLNGSVQVKPSWTGKMATALQMIALTAAMLQLHLFKTPMHLDAWKGEMDLLDLLVIAAGTFTAISGFGYMVDGIRQLHAKGHGDPKPWTET